MKKHFFLILIMFSLVGLSNLKAQQASFVSKLLGDMAKDLHYQLVDTVKAESYSIGTAWGKTIMVEYDEHHVVTQIGLKLFAPQMKKEVNPIVYNFLERYFLEIYNWKNKTTSLAQKLNDDKVYFTKGTVGDCAKITDQSVFSLSRVEDKYYEVSWRKNTTASPFLSLAFPIQYELLLGMPQAEIEQTMQKRILRAGKGKKNEENVRKELLKGNIYSSLPKKYYALPSVTNSSYYYKEGNGKFKLICDTINPTYSAMNIFHVLTKANNPIHVEQSIYGFKKLNYTISLHQWLNYCQAENLTVYTAVETEYDAATQILLIAENKDLGYNHVLSVMVPKDFAIVSNRALTAKLNAFITTHNVKNLYQQYRKTNKKKF